MINTKILVVGGGSAGAPASTTGTTTLVSGPGYTNTALWSKFGSVGLRVTDYSGYSFDSAITGDFTVELWFAAQVAQTIGSVSAEVIYLGGNESLTLVANGFSGQLQVGYTPVPFGSGSTNADLGAIGTAPTYLVLQRTVADGKLAVYRDGVRLAFVDYGTSEDRNPTGISLTPPETAFIPVIDELRVSSVARYTSGGVSPATIPVQSATFAGATSSNTVFVLAPAATVSARGGGYAYLSCPAPTIFAPAPARIGNAQMNSTSPTISAFGGAAFVLGAPAARVAAFSGATSSLTAPSLALFSAGHNSAGENDFTYTAPSALLSAHGGANARLTAPGPALTTTATFTNWGKASIGAPSATLAAAGTVSGTGQAALTLSTPYKLVGYSGAVASITLTGGYTVQAQSTAGSIGGAAITCPLFELTATATRQNSGSANLLAPAARLGAQAQAWLTAPGATLTAIGSATITATYEAYAVNLLHPPVARGQAAPIDETTHYTNFPFTHVVRYKNSYYGANSTGLYLLEGTTDDGADIPYTLRTAISDFKSPFRKTVASAYFGGRLGPDATMTLYAGEGAQTQAYSYTTPRGALAQSYRQAFGKGIRQHRYYSLGISGTDAMALDSLELDTHNSTRRI